MAKPFYSKKMYAITRFRGVITAYWPLVLVCATLCVIDIVSRVFVNGDEQGLAKNSDDVSIDQVARTLDLSLYKSYMKKLSDYNNSLQQSSSVSETLESENARVQDDPIFWRGARHSYRLIAIFSVQERFAVVQRTHNDTGITDLLDARVGDNLEGFVISNMTAHGLLATHADGDTAQLRLFEPLHRDDDG